MIMGVTSVLRDPALLGNSIATFILLYNIYKELSVQPWWLPKY
jgi:hypothetical protein